MKNLMGAALLCSVLTGCAGMNGDFDCNKTATDQCLTTGEANKLASQGKTRWCSCSGWATCIWSEWPR